MDRSDRHLTEAQLWKRLRDALALGGLTDVVMRRMTERFDAGWPDTIWGCADRAGFVELKTVEGSAEKCKLGVEPAQALFIRSWSEHGGRAGVLVHEWDSDTVRYFPGQRSVAWQRAIQEPGAWDRCPSSIYAANARGLNTFLAELTRARSPLHP